MKYFLSILTLLLIPFSLFAINDDLSISKFTDQETIVSLSPAPAKTGVYADTDIDVVFTVELDEEHIKPNSVRLRHIDGKKMDTEGTIIYIPNEKRLRFTPKTFLEPGVYEVDIKDIKAAKEFKHNEIKNITYRFKVADVTPVSLKITPTPVEIKEGSTTELKAVVVYSDDSENQINTAVWSSKDSNILNVEQNATATGVKEGETTVTASYKGLTSKVTQALVYLEINGHRLPFEPDPVVNNSTLLGIDANNNGVRDDVERYIIIRFSKEEFPKTRTALAMQYAWAKQKIIETPTKESAKYSHDSIDCEYYWYHQKQQAQREQVSKLLKVDRRAAAEIVSEMTKWELKYEVFGDDGINNIVLNTEERIKQDFAFNNAMSGGFYPGRDKSLDNCQVNIDLFGE